MNIKKMIFLFLVVSFQITALTWAPPVTISASPVDNSSSPQVVMDPNGNATSAWVENGFVTASFLPLNGSWGTPVVLSGSGAASPVLGCDGSGNVTALWVESTGVVMTATLPLNGAWSGSTALSSTGASSPDIAVNAAGSMAVVWVRNAFIESSSLVNGGSWTAVVQISPVNSSNPDVAIGTNGKVVAVWCTILGTGALTVESATQTVGGTWGLAVNILPAPSAFSMNYPQISVDASGNGDVVWFHYQVTGSVIGNVFVYTASLPVSSSSWSLPTQISAIGIRNPANLSLRIGTDPSGNKIAIWMQSYDGQSFDVESAVKPIGGAWSLVSQITAANNLYTLGADLSVNSLGNAIVSYMYFDGANVNIESAEACFASPLTSSPFWQNPFIVSMGSNNGFPRIASAFDGTNVDAVAVWLAYNGTNTIVQASSGVRTPPTPPTHLSVIQSVTNFGVFADYYNTISWTASAPTTVSMYVIFRNGLYFTAVDPSVTSVEDHNAIQNGSVTYTVESVDRFLRQSQLASVSFP